MRRTVFMVCVMASLVGWTSESAAQDAAATRYEFRKIVMGVEARVMLHGGPESLARHAAAEAFAELERLDAIFSDYRPDSELMRLCARAGGPPVTISEDLFAVLERAQEISEASDGAFDATAAPYVRIWRKARREGRPPSRAELDDVRALVGWQKLRLARGPEPTAQLVLRGMRLDLGGIAKGYATERAVKVLGTRGYPDSLVQMGGDLFAGAPPPGRDWWFMDAGCGEGALPAGRFTVAQAAVSTSGDTEQHLLHEGVRYSHVIDPRTGEAKTDRLCVTIIARDGATADALASAVRVLGEERGRELARRLHGQVLIDGVRIVPPANEASAGPWIDLLADGLSGWATVGAGGEMLPPDGYRVEDGVLHIPSTPPSGTLATRTDYEDFQLRLDFKLARMANGGLFLRAARDGSNPAYSGCEIQLLDDHNWEAVTNTTLRDWQFTGSLYGAVPPASGGMLAPISQWNSMEVLYQGGRLVVALNGQGLYDVDTLTLDVDPPFSGRAPWGFIGLQRYASPDVSGATAVWVRNMLLREL